MIGIRRAPGYKYDVGIGYVALPADLERDKYITDCYANCHISIILEDGGFFNRVPVSPEVLNFIEFPLETNQMGTPVVYVVDDLFQNPYVISRFMKKNELGDGKEGRFSFRKRWNGSFVEISGSAKSSTLDFIVDADQRAGAINIRLLSKEKNNTFNVDVQGKVNVVSSGKCSVKSDEEVEITVGNSVIKQNSEGQRIDGEKLVLNNGEEAMVLGNKLIEFLRNFVDEVSGLTIEAKPVDPQKKIAISQLKNQLDQLLSSSAYLK